MSKFRLLKADEIEVRVQSVKNGKATMLLYIDSRCVTNLLDEAVGCMNWQTEFYQVNGLIMGKLGIWDDDKKTWVWKSDTGTESNIEAEKGQISDTYKRLLSRWGVTELYSAPRIQLEDDGYNNTGYKVSEIAYEGRKITHLVIVNRFGKEAFRWDINGNNSVSQPSPVLTPQKDKKTLLTEFCQTQMTSGANRDELGKFYKYYEPKCNGWKGNMDLQTLWEKWQTPKAA
jgi:hypothetical protein